TGRLPFEAATSMQVMFGHCSAEIPDPRKLAADIPPRITQIILRAMAKSPADRYAPPREMLGDLRVVLAGATACASDAKPAAVALVKKLQPAAPIMETPPLA